MEYDVAVIGSGPGGYVAAIRLSQLGLKTVCIEKKEVGGTCLNVGCIPSKSLLSTTEILHKVMTQKEALGLEGELSCNMDGLQTHKERVVNELRQGIETLFSKNKVTFLQGTATFTSPHSLKLSKGEEISARFFIIATGSEPATLPFLPFDEETILSSTGALSLTKVPRRLLVVGAGVIGLELGSVFSRLGSKVHFLEYLDRIAYPLDRSLAKTLQESLKGQGMEFSLGCRVKGMRRGADNLVLEVEGGEFEAEKVLVSVGRRPYTQDLGLATLGVTLNDKGQIPVDSNFRTIHSHIFAVGDVIDGPMLAHKASEEGIAVAEIIAGKAPSLSYVTIPSVVYTHPEVASMGLSEEEAKKQGISLLVGQSFFRSNPRAKCMKEEEGWVKVLIDASSHRLIGLHMIGPHVSELLPAGALAMSQPISAEALGDLCYAHPTLSECMKEALLGAYKKAIHR